MPANFLLKSRSVAVNTYFPRPQTPPRCGSIGGHAKYLCYVDQRKTPRRVRRAGSLTSRDAMHGGMGGVLAGYQCAGGKAVPGPRSTRCSFLAGLAVAAVVVLDVGASGCR